MHRLNRSLTTFSSVRRLSGAIGAAAVHHLLRSRCSIHAVSVHPSRRSAGSIRGGIFNFPRFPRFYPSTIDKTPPSVIQCACCFRGISSAGRALHWQCKGRGFEPHILHHTDNSFPHIYSPRINRVRWILWAECGKGLFLCRLCYSTL